jgi:hypothetical protein
MPRMHSADGEPEHEPHTVTDDSTVCVAECVAECITIDVAECVTNDVAECEPDGVTIGIAECESECKSELESDRCPYLMCRPICKRPKCFGQ